MATMTTAERAAERAGMSVLDMLQATDAQCVALGIPRFTVAATVHDWHWTYTGITADEAKETADLLGAGSGEAWTVHSSCRECGRRITRVDTPLPASWAPVPWWHHGSDAEARACPGTGPVTPVHTS